MTSRMCSQWQSFIWSLIGPTGFCSFPGSMSRLGCQNGHLNIEMRHTTEFPEIMQNDSVPIEFIFKKIIFVRRAQRTEFNISSKKQSRYIPYCIRSIHVIRFNVLIVYHPWLSNGFIIDVHLDLGLVKYWAQVNPQLQGKGLGQIFQASYFSFTMVNEIDFGTCQEVKQVILFKGLNILYMNSIF